MFAWRKKPDGFEWHEYVRTTIKVRREARRQRVHEARRAAAQQMNAAGVAMASGARAAGAAAWDGTRAGIGGGALFLQGVLSFTWHLMRMLARPIIEAVERPNIGGPLGLAGAIAFGAGIGRYRSTGLDSETIITLTIGVVLLLALLPIVGAATGLRMPRIPRLNPRLGLAGAVAAVLLAGVAWFSTGDRINVAALGRLPFTGSVSRPVQSYAQAVGSDLLRVHGRIVRLAGIEAPEREQRCGKGANRWRCAAVAESALGRLVSGRPVRCTVSGMDSTGRPLAYCISGNTDINAELVRQGYVFAEDSLFARYGSQEKEARTAKAGMWIGDTERPAEFRTKAWEEAKRRSPDGCPIKGQITGNARVYVLPWSPEYERTRVQKSQGERWFCSEQEAIAAGFKAAQRS